jgi:hypothetical protein
MDETKSSVPQSNYSMLADNGILYRAPSQLSSTVARTYKNQYAQRSQYSVGSPLIFDWNTGTSYVDPQTALLSFDLTLTNESEGALNVKWGGGLGACSLFSEIRIISKNGVEIDRTQDAGLLAKVLADYTLSAEGRRNMQMCDGYSTSIAGVETGFQLNAGATVSYPITIPMKVLSGLFRPITKGMFIPSGLASGLRFEMQLDNPDRVFNVVGGANGDITYTVNDCQMLLQLSDLNDPTQNNLFATSAQSGLEYNFPSYFSSKVSNGNSTRINEQLKKAVSQANRAFAVVLDKAGADYEDLDNSGFNSVLASRVTAFNWRLGSQYYPLERLTRVSNYWAIANACFNTLRNVEWKPNQVDFLNFNNGKAIQAASLDMSDHINLSGSKINNSSVLELRLDLSTTDAVDVVLFLQFTAECRVSGTRSVLKI